MRRILLGLLSTIALIGVIALPNISVAAGPPRVDLKVLLISSGPLVDGPLQLAAWKETLDAIGVPYDTYDRSVSGPVTNQRAAGQPRTRQVQRDHPYRRHDHEQLGLDAAGEKEAIADYERTFGVREIADAAGPHPASVSTTPGWRDHR